MNPNKPKKVIHTDCGCDAECPPGRIEGGKLDGGPTNKEVIAAYLHCSKCIREIPPGVTPREWAQIEVGWTEIGLQVWCKRHECNIMHIDFEGHQHPANLTASPEQNHKPERKT